MPSDTDEICAAEPVYETMAGWQQTTSDARSFKELPKNARNYLKRIEELTEAEIGIISVGPNRDQTFNV